MSPESLRVLVAAEMAAHTAKCLGSVHLFSSELLIEYAQKRYSRFALIKYAWKAYNRFALAEYACNMYGRFILIEYKCLAPVNCFMHELFYSQKNNYVVIFYLCKWLHREYHRCIEKIH